MNGETRRPSRRWVAGLWSVAILLVTCLAVAVEPAAPTGARPAQAPTHYQNPLVNGTTRHPAVLKVGSTYYAYFNGLNFAGSQNVPAYSSADLVSWTQLNPLNVLPTASAGAWADTSSGTNFTSPSVAEFPSNPAASRYVLYFTGVQTSTGSKCIGVATASSPAGPFAGAGTPLICPTGGAQDPSILHGGTTSAQLIYRKNGANPGIYNQSLSADGLSISPSRPTPSLLYAANPSWWHQGWVDRPSIAVIGGKAYLFFSGQAPGSATRAVGWSPCSQFVFLVTSCSQQTHFGTWLAPTGSVTGIGGLQVVKDGTSQWVVYDAGGKMRIDKLCTDHGEPRTNGPSTTPQLLARSADCSTDVPGAPLTIADVTDERVVTQTGKVSFRDGGATIPLNGRLLWVFSDTFTRSPCSSLTNTAALGVPAAGATEPNWTTEPVDPVTQCPSPFVPYTNDENAYNATNWSCSPSPTCPRKRIILWESGGVPQPDGSATAFFWKMIHDVDNDGEILDSQGNIVSEDGNGDGYADVGCALCYEPLGHGLARVNPGSTQVDRSPAASPVACNPTCLFTPATLAGEAGLRRPFVDDAFVYAWMEGRLARVPFADLATASAWRFWTDAGGTNPWSTSPTAADDVPGLRVGVYEVPVGRVDYNPYLDRFVNVVPENVFERNQLMIQTAEKPEGPWTAPQAVYDANTTQCPPQGTTTFENYGFVSEPGLTSNGGRTIYAAYARPGPNLGMTTTCPGQVRLLEVTFG